MKDPHHKIAHQVMAKISGHGTNTQGLLNMALEAAETAESLAERREDLMALAQSRRELYETLKENLDPHGWHTHIFTHHEGVFPREIRVLWQISLFDKSASTSSIECSHEVYTQNLYDLYSQALPHAPGDTTRKRLLSRLEKEFQRHLNPDISVKENKGTVTIEIPSALLEEFATYILK